MLRRVHNSITPVKARVRSLFVLLLAVLLSALLLSCEDGRSVGSDTSAPATSAKLQVHHIDVEEGDAALIISPRGQVAMVDNGRWTDCDNTVAYLQGLGISGIDYHFATHYDADPIGC